MPDLVLINAGELATCAGAGDAAEDRLGLVRDGALVVEEGRISWVGTSKELKRKTFGKPRRVVDAEGGLVTPGYVDSHTHLAFAGSREDELERKIGGETYTEILASGGGIVRTVRETRIASVSKIVEESGERVGQLLRNGVTTVEVKTGYGQSVEAELKLLEAIRRLQSISKADLIPTFLGLHAKPPEFGTQREYVSYVIKEMLPAVSALKGRPAFSDCFCEEGVFSREDCSRYLRASKGLGLRCKVHADEFSDSGGAALAAEAGCISADHLGRSEHSGIRAMARRGVVAVLLPGTSLFSNIPYADSRFISECGCATALGTDLSPNSWIESPQMVMSLACLGSRMTPAEALLGFTLNGARALGKADIGSLTPGMKADLVLHRLSGYRFLPYKLGGQSVRAVFKEGNETFAAPKD